MSQYVYTMNRVGKIVPPKRQILKDISLSFFPGAKIGVLGLNGSGKSTLLKIMAGVDKEIEGEAIPMPGIKVGYLPQEPGARLARIKELDNLSRRSSQTQLVIETPYRNAALMAFLLDGLAPNTVLSVSCGITLPEGWTRSATVAAWRKQAVQMPDRMPAVFVWQAV